MGHHQEDYCLSEGWLYAINCGGGPYISRDRTFFSVDRGYFYEEIEPDSAPGSTVIGWYAQLPSHQTKKLLIFRYGQRDWAENQANWDNTDDDYLWYVFLV